MEFFKAKTDYRARFTHEFKTNPHHRWIFQHLKASQCFQILFDEFNENHFKFFSNHKVHFIYSHAELSFAVGNLKNESVVVIFPDLFKMMCSSLITEASATLAHELGHIYLKHHERKITGIAAQIEADHFALSLGFKEDLIRTLEQYNFLEEIQIRIKKLNE